MPNDPRDGFTVVELLIIIAVAGILLAIAAFSLRAPAAREAANNFQALLQKSRMEAIKRNRAVAVVWDKNQEAMVVRVTKASNAISCSAGTKEIEQLEVAKDVSVETNMPDNGMVWLPNGRAQKCGGGLTASKTTFTSHSHKYDVNVSRAGQVEVEAP
jgi:Tfp pilus assembly protein FimT